MIFLQLESGFCRFQFSSFPTAGAKMEIINNSTHTLLTISSVLITQTFYSRWCSQQLFLPCCSFAAGTTWHQLHGLIPVYNAELILCFFPQTSINSEKYLQEGKYNNTMSIQMIYNPKIIAGILFAKISRLQKQQCVVWKERSSFWCAQDEKGSQYK